MTIQKAKEILALLSQYDESTLKKAHKQMAQKYHPDNIKFGDREKFLEVEEAYELLKKELEKSNSNGEPSINSTSLNEVTCPMCHGKGKRNEKQRTGRGTLVVKKTCKYCRGTGFIEKT